ncbi:helix-turn-helix transcriptional regulator [Sphingomonas colocasiae]|uniref:LuxR family transcriptional regulator n=1 Tax=Sphingomonas colocasiae TaxID=1848973 RepID=A0ABS7PIE1_9SPHN|nr:LuxR family transcriptional regulator [Sphingomonas colocasiae]MBY8821061.1 LuxR family transcriptional regulator [Sphingomonas colocasiae]
MPDLAFAQNFIDLSRSAASVDALFAMLADAARYIGFPNVSIVPVFAAATDEPPCFLQCNNYPEGWEEFFLSQELFQSCPVLRTSQDTTVGFRWDEIVDPTDEERATIEASRRLGLGEGFTVPSCLLGLAHGSVNFVTKPGVSIPCHRRRLVAEIIGSHSLEQLYRICLPRSDRKPVKLTARQMEIVLLAMQGKSDSVIAQLLGITPGSVNETMGRALKAYKVAHRIQLALRAVWSGEVTLIQAIGVNPVPTRLGR